MVTTVRASIGSLSKSVTGATNASPIVITTSTPHGLKQGQRVVISGVTGNTAANGVWRVGVLSWGASTFSLVSSNGNGAYAGGGTVARDYTSIGAWLSGTAGNLVAADEIRIGELCFDSAADYVYLFAADLTASGSTTDATRYRRLIAPSHHYYAQFPSIALSDPQSDTFDPTLGTGVKLTKEVNNAFPFAIKINENFFRLEGIGVELTGTPTSGICAAIDVVCQAAVVDRCFVSMDSVDVSSLTYSAGINHDGYGGSTSSTNYLRVSNCIVSGDGSAAGFGADIGFHSTRQHDRIFNSVAYRCLTTGIYWQGADAHVRNSIAVESGFADFDLGAASGTYSNNISSDTTASGTNSLVQESASGLFRYPQYDDFQLLFGSKAIDSGFDLSAQFTTDLTGATRTTPWEIGAYQGYVLAVTDPPTVVEETIGAGMDYATPALWQAATSGLHLVGRNEIRRGVISVAATYGAVAIAGSITDKTRYRELVPADGLEYDPVANTGVKLSASTVDTVAIDEDHFRMSGLYVENLDVAGGGERTAVRSSGYGTLVDACFGSIPDSTSGARPVFRGTGDNQRWRNCIAVGDSNTEGADEGFAVEGLGSKVQNCVAARIRRGASGTCYSDRGSAGVQFENCIAGSSDVGFDVSEGWQRYNASVDATATGPGSITSIVAADVFSDANANDFRLKAGAVVYSAGINLSHEFARDFAGDVRTGSWEMGAYDGYLVPPQFPAPRCVVTHRMVSAWVLERADGFSLRLAGFPSALIHAGLLFEPSNGVDASARRKEASLREHSVELNGYLSSDQITFEDLIAGKYRGARITEYLIDHKYPFTEPRATAVYYLRDVEYDGEVFRAQVAGVASKLSRTVGHSYGPICRHKLGSPNPDANGRAGCGVDLTSFTVFDAEVESVGVSKLEFDAKDSGPNSIPGSHPDDWFTLGELRWRTGENTGLTSEVRVYSQASRTIALAIETPHEIAVGDRFDIVAGDDRKFSTCRDKFSNAINFGGQHRIPSMDTVLETPSQ
jgi:uncharacterized phage protein (TIGR02218 family)